jgi:hypothetical protein
MLKDGSRIQLDLLATLNIDRILLGATPLKYERELHTVYVDFPETLKAGRTVSIDFFYSGKPVESGRFGGFAFRKDASGHDWINSTCEGPGAMVWWPNKDQWRDEVEEMRISVAIPNHLVDVSNGKFVGKTDLQDGYTRWDWFVQYPINNYNVSVRPMADHPSVHGLEDTLDFAKEGRIRGCDRPVLRQRRPLKEPCSQSECKTCGEMNPAAVSIK